MSWDFPWVSRCLSVLALPLGECQFVSDLGSSRAPIQGFSQGIYSDRARGRRMPYRAGSGHSLAGVPLSAQAGMMAPFRSEEHTSELQSLMRISYAVFCLKKKKQTIPILTLP